MFIISQTKFEKGSVESTHKVPTSHYHTTTLPRSGRVTRRTDTPVKIFKDPPPPRPGHATSIGPRPIVHGTGPPCPPKEKRTSYCTGVESIAGLGSGGLDRRGALTPRAVLSARNRGRAVQRCVARRALRMQDPRSPPRSVSSSSAPRPGQDRPAHWSPPAPFLGSPFVDLVALTLTI